MQDFQSLPGRFFGGGGEAGSEVRRFVGYPTTMATQQQQQFQPVKCPRCDSTNTKFCYYNNYNLSQPRHFCKSCRRYWTKGGVLRNVPVGGGCRKSKRPSSSSCKPPSVAPADKDHHRRRLPSSVSRCSSDSSSLPAATATTSASTAFPHSTTLLNSQIPASTSNTSFGSVDPPLCPAPADIFPNPASGSFAAEAPTAMVGLGFSDPSPAQEKTAEVTRASFIDQTVPVDPRRSGAGASVGAGGGIPALDWSAPVDSHLFDLTSAVDAAAYWNQSHWVDADPALYLS
ncbi:hypothetical protein Cni_G20868 [Canna indica]|uniref:Dof zinc finger protein n=1 Tax=Canna indica TaxID=4628 RepID=A0AAQ3QJU5_9LILI|nr:hypothetical protein Cni_G20868 [Canna indica]